MAVFSFRAAAKPAHLSYNMFLGDREVVGGGSSGA